MCLNVEGSMFLQKSVYVSYYSRYSVVLYNNTANVRMNVTMRRIRATFASVEK